jgi:hypothetical protein
MSDRREITNPHDKMTIDCTDMDAARVAVIVLGNGAYGISGDDGLPILLFGGAEHWAQETYGKSIQQFLDSVEPENLAAVLETIQLESGRSSINDSVGTAHKWAANIRKKLQKV